MNLSKLWEIVEDRGALHAAVYGGHKELGTTNRLEQQQQQGDKTPHAW